MRIGTGIILVGVLTLGPPLIATAEVFPPNCDLVVYDGEVVNNLAVIAGCTEPTCLGAVGVPQTGVVTHNKNEVGWAVNYPGPHRKIVELWVDGRRADSAGTEVMIWNATNEAVGPHSVQCLAIGFEGQEVFSDAIIINKE
jgi:hypothetical protein